jgi:hypothetical protein
MVYRCDEAQAMTLRIKSEKEEFVDRCTRLISPFIGETEFSAVHDWDFTTASLEEV